MAKRSSTRKTYQAKKKSSSSSKRGKGSTRARGKRTRSKRGKGWQESLNALLNGTVWGSLLLVLALFTLLALLSPSRGSLTNWWLEELRVTFGVGIYWLPVVLAVVGIYLYLNSHEQTDSFTFPRLFGFLLVWGVLQTTIHLLAVGDQAVLPERSQAGDYGGWMGWVVGEGLRAVFGQGFAVVILALLAFGGIALMLGVGFADLGALLVTLVSAGVGFIGSLPERWRQRGSGVIRIRPSRWTRFKLWLKGLRRPRIGVPILEDEVNGPVSTLPPDPALGQPRARVEPAPPTVRIIGSQQTTWRLPRVEDILDDFGGGDLTEEDLAERARIIEETLAAFGVPVTVVEVNKGPVVTQFGLRPEYITRKVRGEEKRMKVRVSKIQALANDLSLALAAAPIRIEAPVPGRNIVGLEVPNQSVAMVSLRGILESEEFRNLKAPLRICLGQDVSGRAVAASLARMPHLLIAGATGSGKSVCVNAIICSLLFQYTPDQLRFVMVDPKRVELTGYNGIPHLIDSVVTDIEKVVGVLHWATTEMDRRYKELERAGARNIDVYNARRSAEGKSIMPYIVIIIDELADIMMMAPDDVERSLVRIAQMARATGIHLVIATQRPSVNVVTGLIKANFPSRIAFAVTSQVDSRVILDTPGAERLLGRGDMLFMRPDSAK
ncbi:MAG: DNA translocase FtsK, partial [Chloroflexi bacterium]